MDLIGSGDGCYGRGKIILLPGIGQLRCALYYTTEAGEALIMAPGSVMSAVCPSAAPLPLNNHVGFDIMIFNSKKAFPLESGKRLFLPH